MMQQVRQRTGTGSSPYRTAPICAQSYMNKPYLRHHANLIKTRARKIIRAHIHKHLHIGELVLVETGFCSLGKTGQV